MKEQTDELEVCCARCDLAFEPEDEHIEIHGGYLCRECFEREYD